MSAAAHFPHLDLEDLIAAAAGQPFDGRARLHLARCEPCRREADRWNLVAAGVRSLAATSPGTAPPFRPRRSRRRVLASPWRRAMLAAASAAAALVLLIGIGEVAGIVHVHLDGPGDQPVLTAVTGCTQLQQADGKLEQVNGSSLVIKTASGQPVTVTMTQATSESMSGAPLSDITDGASVAVRGTSSGGTVTAALVIVGSPLSAIGPPDSARVEGTVSDRSAAGFTLVTSAGTQIPVALSDGTLVVVLHARPGQLQAGTSIFAVGHAGPDGTLTAQAVAAVSRLPAGTHVTLSVKDCSPSSVTEALAAIGATPSPAS
jgi:hypothetical protein